MGKTEVNKPPSTELELVQQPQEPEPEVESQPGINGLLELDSWTAGGKNRVLYVETTEAAEERVALLSDAGEAVGRLAVLDVYETGEGGEPGSWLARLQAPIAELRQLRETPARYTSSRQEALVVFDSSRAKAAKGFTGET